MHRKEETPMCCITLTALPATMPTTELRQAVNHEVPTPWLPQNADRKPVRMNWVVATDKNGKRSLGMHWDMTCKDD